MSQTSIRFQEHIDQGMENVYGPLAYENHDYPSDSFSRPTVKRPVPIGHGPFTREGREWRDRVELHTMKDGALLKEQDDAYEYLLESLSTQQRDALLVLAQKSPKQGLSQLIRTLHKEWECETRRAPENS